MKALIEEPLKLVDQLLAREDLIFSGALDVCLLAHG